MSLPDAVLDLASMTLMITWKAFKKCNLSLSYLACISSFVCLITCFLSCCCKSLITMVDSFLSSEYAGRSVMYYILKFILW
jgi:hypothetical protein